MDPLLGSPTAKALRTLELLQVRGGVTAQQLADRLGVSDRAARRYIALLRDAGIPVESTTGPYGGYRLGRGVRPPPLVFTAAEALGLVMAVLDGHHAAADDDDPVGAALGKLVSALPDAVGRHAAAMRRLALAAPDRRAVRPDATVATVLVEGIAERQSLELHYRRASGQAVQTRVDPWALVVRHGRWYLICFAHHVGAARAYRVDRIEAVEPCACQWTVERPLDLDPVAWLEEHLGSQRRHPTHVVFDAPIGAVAPHVSTVMGRLEPVDGAERCALIGTTDNTTMYAGEWLAAIPVPFVVVGGTELRTAVRLLAARLDAAVAAPDAGLGAAP